MKKFFQALANFNRESNQIIRLRKAYQKELLSLYSLDETRKMSYNIIRDYCLSKGYPEPDDVVHNLRDNDFSNAVKLWEEIHTEHNEMIPWVQKRLAQCYRGNELINLHRIVVQKVKNK